jgi:hypothetical protein
MVVLDSDHMSLLQRGGAEGQRIRQRLRALPPDDITRNLADFGKVPDLHAEDWSL